MEKRSVSNTSSQTSEVDSYIMKQYLHKELLDKEEGAKEEWNEVERGDRSDELLHLTQGEKEPKSHPAWQDGRGQERR